MNILIMIIVLLLILITLHNIHMIIVLILIIQTSIHMIIVLIFHKIHNQKIEQLIVQQTIQIHIQEDQQTIKLNQWLLQRVPLQLQLKAQPLRLIQQDTIRLLPQKLRIHKDIPHQQAQLL